MFATLFGRKWIREHNHARFDLIDLDQFVSSSFRYMAGYIFMWAMILIALAAFGSDIYTAIALLAFDRWSSSIQPYVPFRISRWIFAGCIILSVVLYIIEIILALKTIRTKNISLNYTNPISRNIYSIRGYKYFCLFAKITKSRNKVEYLSLFVFFTFKGWARLIFAESPRQVLNALTLYSVLQISEDFIEGVKELAAHSLAEAVVVSFMAFSLVIWVINIIQFGIALLCALPLYIHIDKTGCTGLEEFCCVRVNARIQELVEKHHRKGLEQLAKENRSLGKQPTLPDFTDFEQLGSARPAFKHQYSNASLSSVTSTSRLLTAKPSQEPLLQSQASSAILGDPSAKDRERGREAIRGHGMIPKNSLTGLPFAAGQQSVFPMPRDSHRERRDRDLTRLPYGDSSGHTRRSPAADRFGSIPEMIPGQRSPTVVQNGSLSGELRFPEVRLQRRPQESPALRSEPSRGPQLSGRFQKLDRDSTNLYPVEMPRNENEHSYFDLTEAHRRPPLNFTNTSHSFKADSSQMLVNERTDEQDNKMYKNYDLGHVNSEAMAVLTGGVGQLTKTASRRDPTEPRAQEANRGNNKMALLQRRDPSDKRILRGSEDRVEPEVASNGLMRIDPFESLADITRGIQAPQDEVTQKIDHKNPFNSLQESNRDATEGRHKNASESGLNSHSEMKQVNVGPLISGGTGNFANMPKATAKWGESCDGQSFCSAEGGSHSTAERQDPFERLSKVYPKTGGSRSKFLNNRTNPFDRLSQFDGKKGPEYQLDRLDIEHGTAIPTLPRVSLDEDEYSNNDHTFIESDDEFIMTNIN